MKPSTIKKQEASNLPEQEYRASIERTLDAIVKEVAKAQKRSDDAYDLSVKTLKILAK